MSLLKKGNNKKFKIKQKLQAMLMPNNYMKCLLDANPNKSVLKNNMKKLVFLLCCTGLN
jgi:hypothetical protein